MISVGLIGQKCGMSRLFNEEGQSVPVSIISVIPNRITQIKTTEIDGYQAIQVTTGFKKPIKVNKPSAGHFKKASVEAGTILREFRVDADAQFENFNVGDELNVQLFTSGQKVDVIGTSLGKGFAGTIKRHHFSGQRNSHGNSLSHRAPGSIGQNQSPGKVFKGKKMCGQLGNVRRTLQNLEIVEIDEDKGLLMVKGAIPGVSGGYVIVKPAVKKARSLGEKK